MQENERVVGAGPHPQPWPQDERLDPVLLRHGDARNVTDEYRYWRNEAIAADLDTKRHPLHIAIENWQHDFNIGTIVRNANAFNAAAVHVIGKRKWNRRGAMVTDRYLHVEHHASAEAFKKAMEARGLIIIAIDNIAGSRPLATMKLPEHGVFVFGGEGPGLSDELLRYASQTIAIEQFGSTRSVNVGVASGIVMYAWAQQHVLGKQG